MRSAPIPALPFNWCFLPCIFSMISNTPVHQLYLKWLNTQ